MAGFPTLDEAGITDPGGRQHWLHCGRFEGTIPDRSNLIYLERMLVERFSRDAYAVIMENDGSGRPVAAHLIFAPDEAVAAELDAIFGDDDASRTLDEDTYQETADMACREYWRVAHMATRIELADKAGLSSTVTLFDDMPDEVRDAILEIFGE